MAPKSNAKITPANAAARGVVNWRSAGFTHNGDQLLPGLPGG